MALEAAPFVWGDAGAQLTPGQIATRRQLAQAMQAQGMDYSPIKSGWQGAARVAQALLGTADSMSADKDETAARSQAIAGLAAALGGGAVPGAAGATPAIASATPSAAAAPIAAMPAAGPTVDTSGKIYSNDEPSPLDPPSGDDRVRLAKTILGEAGNEPALGQNAVASVVRTRAVDGGYGGDTPSGVVLAKNQFEPWNTADGRARMDRAYADPNQRAAAEAAIAAAYGEGGRAPEDPTEGMTHFYSPAGQAALGRPAPAWAGGESVTIGGHVFNSPDDAAPAPAAGPVRVASAGPMAFAGPQAPTVAPAAPDAGAGAVSPAVATVAQAMPAAPAAAAPASPGAAAILKAISNPYLPPQVAAIGAAQLAKTMQPQVGAPYKDADGNLVQKATDGTVHMLSAADKTPTSVLEYNFYKSNLPPGAQPMDYSTWSTAKSRAGATNVTTTVGGENKGLQEASKLDAESVRKGQNELMPALEDADHNFQLMQAAIDRNGGKLPTGGELGKLGLDWNRTKDYIQQNWGIDLGSDPNTTTSLETLNKGGIKAAGDMAKAIGGSRVLKVEFDMAQRANPGLETSDGGNKYLLDVNRNGIAIKRDYLQAQEDYWRANNHSLDGFQKSWNAEIKDNPRPLSNYSVAPPVPQEDGSQFVKLPSTAQGGYSWYRKGQDGTTPVTDPAVASRLDAAAQPLKPAAAAPLEKVIGGKTYQKIDNNWFEKPSG